MICQISNYKIEMSLVFFPEILIMMQFEQAH